MDQKYKALILEDNEVDASLLKKYLNRSTVKYKVECVSTGSDFEKKVRSFKPDVIITDYRMKDYSGHDALKFRNKHCSNIPFVIVSGHIGEEKAAKLIKEGATDFLMKNNTEASLSTTILRVINEFQERERSRRFEESAMRNHVLLETISKQADLPVWIRDQDGKFYYVNNQFRKIFNLDDDIQIIGKTNTELLDEKIAAQFDENDKRVLEEKKSILIEEKVITSQGVKYYQTNLFPITELPGLDFAVGGLAVDITSQKKSEIELQKALIEIGQTYERFEKVTEATNDAIWDWDLENDTLLWGGGFKTLFGYDVERVTPSLNTWTEHIHEDDQVRVLSSLYATVEDSEQSNWQSEYKYLRKDGSYAYVIDRAIIIRDEQGKASRVIGAMTDITYHHKYEENLQNLNTLLQEYTRELEVSNTELEHFAYVASHDLQEPLRMITSFMELLKTKYGEELDEKAHQYIYYALDGAKRMRELILDLLDFSRVGKSEDDKEWLNLNETVDFVCQMQQKIIKEKNAAIEIEDLPEIYSYRSPIIQIFQNLIGNALKYSKEGVDSIIHISSSELDEEWQFVVKDNGIGIDPDYFEKIFIIFQRLHTNHEYDGSGIGLTIVKKIIENLNGRIWVESKKGEGSTFFFTIPKSE